MNVNFFEYGKLRRIWQYELLTGIKANMLNTPETSQLIDSLFKKYENGFYVYAEKKLLNAKKAARYIGRYIRHPAIAESRITNFDEKANTVTFWYTRNGKRIETTIPALEFIDKLVKLKPDKNFKMIRYYGAYSGKTRKKLHNAITALTRDIPPLLIEEPQPVICSRCGTPTHATHRNNKTNLTHHRTGPKYLRTMFSVDADGRPYRTYSCAHP